MLSLKFLPLVATLIFSVTSTFAAHASVHAASDTIGARDAGIAQSALLHDDKRSIPDILQGVIDKLGPLAGALGGIDPSHATLDDIGRLVSEIEGVIRAGIDAVGGDGGNISFFDVLEFGEKVGEFVNTLFDAIGSVLDKAGLCNSSSSDTEDDSDDNCSDRTTVLLSALANLAGELISTMLGGGAGGTIIKILIKVALPLIRNALPVIERLGVEALSKIFKP